jgi:hypothetical protein
MLKIYREATAQSMRRENRLDQENGDRSSRRTVPDFTHENVNRPSGFLQDGHSRLGRLDDFEAGGDSVKGAGSDVTSEIIDDLIPAALQRDGSGVQKVLHTFFVSEFVCHELPPMESAFP